MATNSNAAAASGALGILLHVQLPVTILVGKTTVALKRLLEMEAGAVVELDRLVGDPVEVLVHDRVLARGELVAVDDHYAVRIQEVEHDGFRSLVVPEAGA